MLSPFKPCSFPGCTELTTFRNLKLCVKHYQHQKYLERKALAIRFDPAEATKAISVCLTKFRDLRDGGVLHQLRFAGLQHEFLGYYRQLINVVENDYETQEMAEADDEYTQHLLKQGAVEAESPEQAKELLEERQKPKLPAAQPEDVINPEPKKKDTDGADSEEKAA